MLISTITTRLATLEDVPVIKYIADRNKKTIGFVNRGALIEAIEHDCLYVAEDIADGCVIGFANIWKRRRDDWITLMEICIDVDYRRCGAGRALITKIRHSNFDRPVRLKCPVDNESNEFYRALGFRMIRTEPAQGKKRALNVWVVE
jgi:N-acetylglutamate synthase-like GNAT family acetyltransferase